MLGLQCWCCCYVRYFIDWFTVTHRCLHALRPLFCNIFLFFWVNNFISWLLTKIPQLLSVDFSVDLGHLWPLCGTWTSLLNYFPWTLMHDLCPTDCLPVSYETIDISPFLGRSTSFSRVSLFNVCAFIRHARPPVASPECWLARPCRGQLSLWCCTGFLQWRNDATALPL